MLVDAAERVADGVEDAHAVGVVRRKDDAPVAGRRRASNFQLMLRLEAMSTQRNASLTASKTPTQSASCGAKTTRPLAAVAAP